MWVETTGNILCGFFNGWLPRRLIYLVIFPLIILKYLAFLEVFACRSYPHLKTGMWRAFLMKGSTN